MQKQNTVHAFITEADTERSLQFVLDQGNGTPIWRAEMLTNQYVFHALLPAVEIYWRSLTIVTTSSEPSLSCGSNADMLHCCSGTTQDYTGCIHSMQCIPLSKPIHPAAGARHLPVTSTTPERSFSTLKRLKTYLRSSMGNERLTSLALIHVHAQTTPIEPVEVVDKFVLTGPHKLNFLRQVIMFLSLFISLY